MRKYKVGIIGCGNISGNYLRYAKNAYADYFDVVAVCDIDFERAKAKAEKHEIPRYGTPEVIYNADDIDIVINLTIPVAHEEVTIKALESGKHVYSEKPLACSREGMKRIMEVAKKCNKRVGCAPDSFLSGPMQTAKKALEEDWIGDPVGINAICALRGNELWRPDSDFFYKKGAGPMMDMAAYYLNIFISLVGPVDSVQTLSKITFPERTIKVAPRRGDKIQVEVPTYVTTALNFENGVIGTFVNSFDIWATKQPHIEIFGEKGTMVLPDPNRYEGEVFIKRFKDTEWRALPQFVEYREYGRGIGIVDMIRAIENDTEHKANLELAYHTTDIIMTIDEACEAQKLLKVNSTAKKPEGLWTYQESILWK